MYLLIIIAIFMVVGLLSTRLMKIFNLPNVTGYLLAGLICGPTVVYLFNTYTHIFPEDLVHGYQRLVESLSIITSVALGFIALSIGVEFKFNHIKEIGKRIVVVTFWQCLLAVLLVDAALLIFALATDMNPAVAITLGAIASATAPAATLLVVKQYNAKGPVVDTLLPVVALDDAIGLVIFSISFAIAQVMSSGEAVTVTAVLINPLIEIVASLVLGFVCGAIVTLISKYFLSRANNMTLLIAFTFLCVGVSQMKFHIGEIEISFSSLLVCMMLGATYTNLKPDCERFLHRVDEFTPPLFLLFFVISGADMDITIIPTVGLIGVIYIAVRSAGKILGAYVGCKMVKTEESVAKYLGLTLLPQAGVAIGMANIAREGLGDLGLKIYTVVLFSTFMYEIFGPLLTKWALNKAGEIPHEEEQLEVNNQTSA